MAGNNDFDMKIFKPVKSNPDSGIVDIIESMNYQRKNGNVDKAKELGRHLADEDIASLKNGLFDDNNKNDTFQAYSLLLFSAEAALNFYLPSPALSTISINSMHEALMNKNPSLYGDVMSGSAFSFYYLSVRKGGTDIPEDIGKAFAMLCGDENDAKLIEIGKNIYSKTLSLVEKRIIDFSFAN